MSPPNLSRRFFLRGKISARAPTIIRPPWAIEDVKFLAACNRCNDCISACPEDIISQGDGGYPEINFKHGECTFCTKCVESCKTGVLQQPDDLENKDENAWQLEVSINKKCLSLNAVVCRACGENCGLEAIQFQLKKGGISEPHVSLDNCNGCGACVSVCPVDAVVIIPQPIKLS